MDIIAFAGTKGAGKDTAADALPDRVNVKFAGGIKIMLGALMRYQGATTEEVDAHLEGDKKGESCPYLNGQTARYAMQALGEDFGRQSMGEHFWVSVTGRYCAANGLKRIVITDVRHENECEFVHGLGGLVFRIDNGVENKDPHPSEIKVALLPVNGVLWNGGTIDALHDRVREAVGES